MLKLKNLLTEAPSDDLAKVFKKGGGVSKGRAELAKVIGQPKVQALLNAGEDDGDPDDDKFPYTETPVKVIDLLPTQNQIGFDQSVMNLLTDEYGSLQSFLDGNADVGGPIVTYAGKYIIDGHHRWSQVFAANPFASMDALDIAEKPGFSHTDMLKAVHGAIAADIGKVPAANPKGVNLLKGVDLNLIQSRVMDNFESYPAVEKTWMENSPVYAGRKKIELTNPGDVATAIHTNLELMIKRKFAKGAPGRKDMPQSDSGGKPKDRLDQLAKGAINVSEPFGEGKSLKERFQKIANIKKSK
tara:strand:+ start:43 stop:942 length:900 start_codon:yes stop_codon:yes gene_type:complete